MKCSIEVNGLRMRARHGVLPEERTLGNDFELSLKLDYPFEKALENDDLGSTLNYAETVEIAREVMAEPSALLEHVAGRLKDALTGRWPLISGGCIRVAKLSPPIDACLANVAVVIEW